MKRWLINHELESMLKLEEVGYFAPAWGEQKGLGTSSG
jgi:hypothetical protein